MSDNCNAIIRLRNNSKYYGSRISGDATRHKTELTEMTRL